MERGYSRSVTRRYERSCGGPHSSLFDNTSFRCHVTSGVFQKLRFSSLFSRKFELEFHISVGTLFSMFCHKLLDLITLFLFTIVDERCLQSYFQKCVFPSLYIYIPIGGRQSIGVSVVAWTGLKPWVEIFNGLLAGRPTLSESSSLTPLTPLFMSFFQQILFTTISIAKWRLSTSADDCDMYLIGIFPLNVKFITVLVSSDYNSFA